MPYQSGWVSGEGTTVQAAQDGCWSQLSEMIGGVDSNNGGYCKPDLHTISTAQWVLWGIDIKLNIRTVPDKHIKPRYITSKDPITGIDTQVNLGGHSHHRNRCNKTYRHEKWVFLQEKMV